MGMSDKDIIEMSDDAFLETSPSAYQMEAQDEPSFDSGSEEVDESFESDNNEENEPGSEEESDLYEDSDEDFQEQDGETGSDDSDDVDYDEEQEADEEENEDSDEESEDGSMDYEQLYSEVLAPVKANGNMVDIRNVEEARRLMSMGIDYGRKMKELKNSRKVLQMLSNHDLMGESELSYLIDLKNKNPQAIAKLVQESGYDPYSTEFDESKEYTPSDYSVSDSEVQLQDVIDEIRHTPTYADTMQTVTNMDDASKGVLAKNPQALRLLNEHRASGIYAIVEQEINRERAFGGLEGLSDLQAYEVVGKRLEQSGRFNSMNSDEQTKSKKVVKTAPDRKKSDKALTDKKRQASPTRSKPVRKKAMKDYDFINMSDEEFEKLSFNR